MPTGESLSEILGPVQFLPPEVPATDAELSFIDDSPHDLWPNNQNSTFGLKRKVFTDKIQIGAEQLNAIFAHRFVGTSEEFLDEWEEMTGLPVSTGSLQLRRAKVLARLNVGPFTNELLESMIEEFLVVTSGNPVQFTPEGVPITAVGIPLYGEPTSNVKSLYRIYFDYNAFTYYIYIKNTNNPDLPSLTRELERITPAGWQFVLDNTKDGPLHYGRMGVDAAPILQLRLNGAGTDGSPYGNNGTVNGAPAAVASPGLLHANAILAGSANAAYNFDGVDDYIQVADAPTLDFGDEFSMSVVLNLNAIPAGSTRYTIFSKGTNGLHVSIEDTGKVTVWKQGGAVISSSLIPLVVGTTHSVFVKKRASELKIVIDDVDQTDDVVDQTLENTSTDVFIGRHSSGATNFLNAKIDEFVLYNRYLSDKTISEFHQTRIGVA